MSDFFNLDKGFYSILNTITNLILLNLLCIVCCLPVITAGSSITAAYYVSLKLADGTESYITKSFFKSFKQNFKQATCIWLGIIAICLLAYFDINLAASQDSILFSALQIVLGIFVIFFLFTALYVFPFLSKFENTTKNTIIIALTASIRHFPWTLMILIISALPAALLALSLQYGIFINICIGFSFTIFVNSFIFNRIFKNYISETDDSKLE